MNAVVLASGGLDSTVTAAIAKTEGRAIFLLTILYGQRHNIEVTRAKAVGKWLEARDHKILQVDLAAFGGSALTADITVPKHRSSQDRETGIPATYVSARNLIFLSLAVAYAETIGAGAIYFGANIRDYSGYPDCRPEFLNAFMETVRLGTRQGVQGAEVEIIAPLLFLTKADIIRKGADLGVPFHLTHSCYDPDKEGVACGTCDSCVIRKEGFEEAGLHDPVPYQTT